MNRCLLFLFVLLSGCSYFVTWEQSVEGGVGRPVDDIIKTWGKPDSIKKDNNGNSIYKYHLKKLDPSCIHYWIVGDNGIIIDFYYEGNCSPIG